MMVSVQQGSRGYRSEVNLVVHRHHHAQHADSSNNSTVSGEGEEETESVEEKEQVISLPIEQFYTLVILNASTVTIQYAAAVTDGLFITTAFMLRFSFHPPGRVPQRVGSGGLYNCSVDYFSTFRHHLDCNRRQDCEAGQDEGDHCYLCPPGQAAFNRT
jgi:hypothetical protein